MKALKSPFTILLCLFLLSSCVPKKKLTEMENLKNQVQSLLSDKDKSYMELQEANAGLQGKLKDCEDSKTGLNQDSKQLAKSNLELKEDMEDMKAECNRVNDNYEQLKTRSSKKLQQLVMDLESLQKDLSKREKRLAELENALHERDSVMNALHQQIAGALMGFKDKGLTVEFRDGKVYISLSNKLLYKSGSIQINDAGKVALKDLAEVLKTQEEVTIMVEGHTDNVPVSNLGDIKDNWDLSVMRSTEVVRILVDEGLEPTRTIPAGRGEVLPKEAGDSPEARAANRRTEIIISPKLDMLYKIASGK